MMDRELTPYTAEELADLDLLTAERSPGVWEADIDDPATHPFWTGKFYCADRSSGEGEAWCTYEDNSPELVANARFAAAAPRLFATAKALLNPIDMVIFCPFCGAQHVDAPDPASGWDNPPHRSHLCHICQKVFRLADVPTNGVAATKTKGKADAPLVPAGGLWSGSRSPKP